MSVVNFYQHLGAEPTKFGCNLLVPFILRVLQYFDVKIIKNEVIKIIFVEYSPNAGGHKLMI